jgi:hypothetical protein
MFFVVSALIGAVVLFLSKALRNEYCKHFGMLREHRLLVWFDILAMVLVVILAYAFSEGYALSVKYKIPSRAAPPPALYVPIVINSFLYYLVYVKQIRKECIDEPVRLAMVAPLLFWFSYMLLESCIGGLPKTP